MPRFASVEYEHQGRFATNTKITKNLFQFFVFVFFVNAVRASWLIN